MKKSASSAFNYFNVFRIPLEICLTSNVKGGTVASFEQDHHHFHKWHDQNHPIVICTDDKGVFSTSLSNEYAIASQVRGMSMPQMFELSKSSIDCIFADNQLKKRLRERWNLWMENNKRFFD